MFKLEFETHNAAFDDNLFGEAAEILRDIALGVQCSAKSGLIFDSNGNRIGSWSLTKD
jgi:hypothetical protein